METEHPPFRQTVLPHPRVHLLVPQTGLLPRHALQTDHQLQRVNQMDHLPQHANLHQIFQTDPIQWGVVPGIAVLPIIVEGQAGVEETLEEAEGAPEAEDANKPD
jgi:hypothetical protein